jgi:hypothetical protein
VIIAFSLFLLSPSLIDASIAVQARNDIVGGVGQQPIRHRVDKYKRASSNPACRGPDQPFIAAQLGGDFNDIWHPVPFSRVVFPVGDCCPEYVFAIRIGDVDPFFP